MARHTKIFPEQKILIPVSMVNSTNILGKQNVEPSISGDSIEVLYTRREPLQRFVEGDTIHVVGGGGQEQSKLDLPRPKS